LKVLSLVYVTSLADQVDIALNLYLRDMKKQDIAQPQTLSAENHPITANLKLRLTPDQEAQFKYLANSLGCELPDVLHIIVDHGLYFYSSSLSFPFVSFYNYLSLFIYFYLSFCYFSIYIYLQYSYIVLTFFYFIRIFVVVFYYL
jgi:hypothetical protein